MSPGPLLRLFPEASAHVSMSASNVKIMLDRLDQLYPGIKHCLVDSSPSIRKHINIYVEGVRAELQTRIPDNTKVYIYTAMSGG